MTLAQIISQKTAGGTGSLFTGLKNFFSTDAGDTSVSNSERWVFMGCRFIFHIAAAICTFYAPMKILPEPFQEVFPQWGNTIAVALSCVFVFAIEFFTYSIARRATINSLKLAKEDFQASVLGSTLLWFTLSLAIGYFSWACAQSGAENIAFQKTDKSGEIVASKGAAVGVLTSSYKELVRTTTAMHDKEIRGAAAALAQYQKRKWTDPTTLNKLTDNVSAARAEKTKELDRIKADHQSDLAAEDGKAQPLLEKNAAKQSMYQKYIPFVSLMIEFGKFIFIFLLVQLGYKGGGQRPQQRRQERFDEPEPQTFVEKKTFNHIPTPIVMEEEEEPVAQSPISHAAPSENSTPNPLREYALAMNNRNKLLNDFKNHFEKGKLSYEVLAGRWEKNEARIKAVCEQLGQPYVSEAVPTNPNSQKLP